MQTPRLTFSNLRRLLDLITFSHRTLHFHSMVHPSHSWMAAPSNLSSAMAHSESDIRNVSEHGPTRDATTFPTTRALQLQLASCSKALPLAQENPLLPPGSLVTNLPAELPSGPQNGGEVDQEPELIPAASESTVGDLVVPFGSSSDDERPAGRRDTFPWYRLPRGLRNAIYALASERTPFGMLHEHQIGGARPDYTRLLHSSPMPITSLLLVDKQFQHEYLREVATQADTIEYRRRPGWALDGTSIEPVLYSDHIRTLIVSLKANVKLPLAHCNQPRKACSFYFASSGCRRLTQS